ncbi:hypothetical protein ColTof4_11008 [Colletotrichum tofieldiae]|nr:hypothetical protein ColTof4_11008 [Colletotrichum tofieldiae]
MEYYTEESAIDQYGDNVTLRYTTVQLNHAVAVEGDGTEFRINPNKHSTHTWAYREALNTTKWTDEMKSGVVDR